MYLRKTNFSYFLSHCQDVEAGAEKLDNKEDSSSMAKNEENADSGNPSLSEEENNVSEQTPSDRPTLVVDLNIPLQHDSNEPGEGVVNYGFEFGENQQNDCAENFNDSKPLAKDKYVTESANHRYGAALLGKVLNTSCDTEIAIPDDHDPNMNCHMPKTRLGNAKNKENHITEKIPLEEVTSTVVPIISDNCEKALEAQKECSATQNGGKDICHDRAAVNTDKLNQQNNGKRFEEYFMPANTHKKFLRGEKLYLTKEKGVAACSGWKLAIVCGSLLLVTLGVLLGVLAGVGVLVKEPATVMKSSSLPNSASMSAEAKHSNELPLSSLPITVNPNSPSLQSVPKVLIVELTLANESFGDNLLNSSSKEYISLVSDMRKLLTSKLKNLELNSSTSDIRNSSITARFVASLQSSEISENNTKEIIENYFKQSNNMFSSYYVRNISVWFTEKFNTCLKNNGNCSHECHWNWGNYSQTCFCPSNFTLSDDSKTCLKKQLGDDKINGLITDTIAVVPKMTEAPTTHSSELLVTNVDSTMPNVGSSTRTSVSESTTMYNISSLRDAESLVTNAYSSVFNTEHSRTSYDVDHHEADISNSSPNENKILELSTDGRADYTSDLATFKSRTEEKYGWTDNLETTTEKHWPMIINLTDIVEVTSIYNSDSNTLDTLSTVTDIQFGQPLTRYTTINDFSDEASSETSLTVENSSVFEETSSLFIESNVTNATDDEESVTYGNGSVTKVTRMEMFTDTFDQNTTGSIEASDTAPVRAEDVSANDNATEVLSTDSSETNTNWANASGITTASAFVYSGYTVNTDSYNQTTILQLNLTNSANVSDSTSPLYVTSTQHTAIEQETQSLRNVTKEHTFTSLSSKLENSSEAILHTIGSTEEITDSEVSSTSNPNVSYGSNENVTDLPSTLTASSDLLSAEQSAGENESTTEISNIFDIPNATLPSEEVPSEGKTSFNATTELLYLTTSVNDTVYPEDDEIINGSTTSNDFTTDVKNIMNLYTSNNTEVSTTMLPFITTVVNGITEVSRSIQSSTATGFNDITSHVSNITELSTEASTIAAITDISESLETDFPFTVTDTSNATTDSVNNFSLTEISGTTEIPKTTVSYAVTDSSSTEDLRNYLTSAIIGVNNFTSISINNLTSADVDNNDTKDSIDSTVTDIDNVTKHPGIIHSATTESDIFKGGEKLSTITDFEKITAVTEDPRNISFATDFSNIAEDSRNDSSFAGTVSSETSTMEYIQTKGILHKIEKFNASTTEPHVNSTFENPAQDTEEVTSDITSTVEITSTLSADNTEATEYAYDANNFTIENNVFVFNVSVDPNYSNSVQSMDFTTYSNHFDTNTSNVDTSDNSTISSSFLLNSTETTTTMETEQASKLSFGDSSVSQLNETEITILGMPDGENSTEVVNISIYIANENSSLNYGNFTSDIFNQSDFEVATLDGFDSNAEYENHTDEVNVTQPSMESAKIAMNGTSNCSEGMFPCSDGITCLDLMEQCDGVERCPGGSDEKQCNENCGLNFRCVNTSACISASARCDSIWDCEDGSDEDGCEPTSCEPKEVMCSDGSACIKPADICNEQYNCRDKSDEVGCVERTTCDTTNRFFCPEGLCIPLAQVCDAVQDCRNGEDEANCSCTGSDVFQCSNSVCLTKDVLCNGKEDCQDGSDERGCVQVDENGVVQVYDHNNQTWKILCAEDWSESEGDFVCQDLGFGSASEVGVLPLSTNIGWMRRNNYTADNSTLWTLGMEPVDFCLDSMAATVKCKEYSCGGTRTAFRRKRESGGQDTLHLPGQWTSLVLLYSSESNKTCHGVVISPLWVLTSSQCLISHFPDFTDLSVRAGILTSNERQDPKQNGSEPQERNVQEVVIHPHSSIHRSPALRDYDVALIRTHEPFKLDSNVNAICLGEEEIQEGITCFTGSFRSQNTNEIHTASSLSHLAVSVTDRNSCNSTNHYSKSITNRMICGQTTGETALCNNDDAVPLMCLSTRQKYHVAGMLSYQHNCGVYLKQPAVFSNINDMRPFIETMIGKYRYRVPYGRSLYFEATESSLVTESNSTLGINVTETTLQTELLVTTDTMPDIESTDITTLTQISDFTLETNSTVMFGNASMHVTTAMMTEAYLLNETEHNQNMTSEGLEDRSNKTVSLKLVSSTDVSQDYVTTATDATNEPENISSTYFTSIAPTDASLLTEIHLTVPSIQEPNNTDYSDTKEERVVANYESASVVTTTLIPENNTGKTDQETALSLFENQFEDVVNTSSTVNAFLVENKTWSDATHSILDTTAPDPASEVLNIDSTVASVDNYTLEIENNNSTETHTNNPITDISAIRQHLLSQSHNDSIHLENISQSSTLVTNDVNEDILRSEYESTDPTVTQNPIEMTILVNTGVTEESSQSPENLITAVNNVSKNEDMALFVRTENSTASVYSTLTASSDNFDITTTSLSNSTFTNTNSESSILPFQTSTYLPTASDVVTTISIANITIEKESNFQTVDEIMNATISESGLMKEVFGNVQNEETGISREGFDKSINLSTLKEHYNISNLNYSTIPDNTTSESSISEEHLIHFSYECGTEDLEEANATWPYIGILRENVTCLASIISSKWVIASHHCLLSGAPSNGTAWTFLKGHFHSAVKNILVHPQSKELGIDVALVELDGNLESNSSICLPKHNITSQHHCEVVRIENVEGDSKIIYTPVSFEPVMNCDIFYNQLSVQNICINNIKQTCQDNGTHLMCINDVGQWQLQGISSIKQCEDNSTSVYIDITSVVPWIENSVVL